MATIPADGKVVEGAPVVMATTATVVANPAPMPTEVPLAHVEGGIAQSAVDADGVAIVRSVKLEGRAFTDKKFAYFYGGCIGLFVILSIVLSEVVLGPTPPDIPRKNLKFDRFPSTDYLNFTYFPPSFHKLL